MRYREPKVLPGMSAEAENPAGEYPVRTNDGESSGGELGGVTLVWTASKGARVATGSLTLPEAAVYLFRHWTETSLVALRFSKRLAAGESAAVFRSSHPAKRDQRYASLQK